MKKFRMIAMALLLFALLTVPVSAMQEDSTQSQLEAYGTVELFDDLPQETRALFEELGIEEIDFNTLFQTSPRALVEMFLNLLQGKLNNPLKTALQILGVFNPACGCRIFIEKKAVRPIGDGVTLSLVFIDRFGAAGDGLPFAYLRGYQPEQ